MAKRKSGRVPNGGPNKKGRASASREPFGAGAILPTKQGRTGPCSILPAADGLYFEPAHIDWKIISRDNQGFPAEPETAREAARAGSPG